MYIQLYTQIGSLMFDLNCIFYLHLLRNGVIYFILNTWSIITYLTAKNVILIMSTFIKPEAGIDAMLLAVQEAFAAKDGETISQHYTEDCQLLMEGRDIIKGREGSSHSIV